MYFVYLVKCKDDTFYAGITTNLERRIKEHNSAKIGAKYTKARRPVELVYFKKCKNRSSATKQELELKSLSREKKIALVESKKQA